MIRTLLIANRGEIALRIARTAAEMGIRTVAVFSDPDARAPFVLAADEAVRLPGAAPADTYLRGDLVVEAAGRCGADAVHPGYGFLSENAGFARACLDAGLTWVGPPPEVIEAMGSKIRAKEIMGAAGVPTLPGATLQDADDPVARAEPVGYPLLVKASAGGGGRGMRVVTRPDDLVEAVASARREAGSAFGDATVFLERLVVRPRHVEVQIFGDSFGDVVALHERECSIQRRYQKILEECPSPAVDADLRAQLCSAAVAAGKALGYVGAGTVEFVLAPDGSFAFLEVNTRLQVEHPVTEAVTGLDLVRLQIEVAEGAALPAAARHPRLDGAAIEVRLYAEEVTSGFRPTTGTLHRFAVPVRPGVRVDSGVADGSVVGVHYDPMLAKVIAHAATRADAARLLAATLRESRIHGVTTNRDLLVRILGEPEFLAGGTDTGYLERHDPAVIGRSLVSPAGERVSAVAAALALQAAARAASPVQRHVPHGWRNVASQPQRSRFAIAGRALEVGVQLGHDGLRVEVDGQRVEPVTLVSADPRRVVLEHSGRRLAFEVDSRRVPGGRLVWVDGPAGPVTLDEIDPLPEPVDAAHAGSLVSPMPGVVVRVAAVVGEHVETSAPLVVLEAMKMEHTVRAPRAGQLRLIPVRPGQQVDIGEVLAVFEDDEPEEP